MRAGKNNFTEVFVYAGILGALLSWRFVRFKRKSYLVGHAKPLQPA
jgi:sulfoxide reductase heme-binding subunit YedZ